MGAKLKEENGVRVLDSVRPRFTLTGTVSINTMLTLGLDIGTTVEMQIPFKGIATGVITSINDKILGGDSDLVIHFVGGDGFAEMPAGSSFIVIQKDTNVNFIENNENYNQFIIQGNR